MGRGGSAGGARGGRPESAQVNPIDPTQGGTGSRAVGIDGTVVLVEEEVVAQVQALPTTLMVVLVFNCLQFLEILLNHHPLKEIQHLEHQVLVDGTLPEVEEHVLTIQTLLDQKVVH